MSNQEDRAQVFGMTLAVALLAAGSVCGGTNTVTVVPPVLDAALRNPMKGFIPHLKELSYPAKSRPPLDYVTLVRHYIRWDDLEETEADGVEKIRAYCDKAWAGLPERNIKVIPRVILQWSGPKWAKKPGDWWTCWPKDMTAGDWESEQFKDRVRKMVKKLGEAWDDDPRVAWVNMAIMGAWGEHHAPGFTPEMEKIFGDAFTAAFRNKRVTVRRPEQFADYAFGLDIDNWNERNHWIYDGTASARKFGDFIRTTHRQLISPIEGEIAYAYPTERKHDFCGDSPDDTLGRQERLDFHVNTLRYFGCTALGWINRYHVTNAAVRAGADLCQRTWGYRYEIDEVVYSACATPGGELSVRVSLHNAGSAPFYCKWPVTASLLDPQTHAVVWEGDFDTDIRMWKPGLDWDMTNRCYGVAAPPVAFAKNFVLPSALKEGRYILALAVLDPAGRLPSLRFATRNYFNGGRHPVGFVSVGCREEGGPLPADMRFDDPNADVSLHYDLGEISHERLTFDKAKPWQRGFRREGNEIVLETADAKTGAGAGWTLPLNQTSPAPVRISAESCGEMLADGVRGWDVFVDVYYTDGTKAYGLRGAFSPEEKGWQRRTVGIASSRPIRSVSAYLRLCSGIGRVRFRAPSVERERPDPSSTVLAGATVRLSDLVQTNAFLLRDAAAHAPFRRVLPGETQDQVRVDVVSEALDGGCRFDVSLESQDDADHALTLVYPVSLGAGDWDWCGTPRDETPFAQLTDDPVVAYDDRPGFRRVSRYAIGAARNGRAGVALGIAPDAPCVYRISADRATRTLFIAFDVAVTRERRTARFGFVRFSFDGRLAFRGALERYMSHYPAAFEVRAKKQGLMMAFAPISRVERYEDFGFRFKEADYETTWDDAHGILTFHYNEPCTWWMKMKRPPDGRSATYAECVAEAERLFREGDARAVAHRLSAMTDAAGRPVGKIMNTPWCDGIVWSECDAPGVGGERGSFSGKLGQTVLAERWRSRRTDEEGLDGEYVDSSELWVAPAYDFNRASFAGTERPLSFDRDTLRPAIYNGLVAFEYCRAATRISHAHGGLSMANATPTRWAWNAMQLDVLCTEVNWKKGGVWSPTTDADLIHKRATIGGKPYNLVMNTDFAAFAFEDSERYFNRAMAYGMFPSYFSGDASTRHFFKNPKMYNAVRPLYVKYLPIIRRVAESGWRPVNRLLPLAAETGVLAEQFGDSLVTLFNPSSETPKTVTVPPCRELVGDVDVVGTVVVPPERCLVLLFAQAASLEWDAGE